MGHRGMDTNNVPFAKGLTVSHLSCVDVNAIRGRDGRERVPWGDCPTRLPEASVGQ